MSETERLDRAAEWLRGEVMGQQFLDQHPWESPSTTKDYWRGRANRLLAVIGREVDCQGYALGASCECPSGAGCPAAAGEGQ